MRFVFSSTQLFRGTRRGLVLVSLAFGLAGAFAACGDDDSLTPPGNQDSDEGSAPDPTPAEPTPDPEPEPDVEPDPDPAPVASFTSGRISFDSTRIDLGQNLESEDDDVETGDIWVMDADGTRTNLTNSVPGTYSFRGQWSGDGSRLVFYSNRDGQEDIYTMAADGSDVVRVTNDETRDYNASFSPDGQLIAWVSHREDDNGDIWIANADGSNARALALNVPPEDAGELEARNSFRDRTPFFSPDGEQIAFHSYRDDNRAQIFIVDVDGENLTQVTDGDFDTYNVEWSPDGTQFLVVSFRNGNPDVYVMDTNGDNETLIVGDSTADTLATWSPDGTQILFNSNRLGYRQMFIAFSDGTGVQPLEPLSTDENNFFGIRDWVE